MAESSIEASFDFLSYKIDKIEMRMESKIGYLLNNAPIKPDCIEFAVALRNTEKFLLDGIVRYVGGLMTQVRLKDDTTKNTILASEFGISGIFMPTGHVEQQMEETFAKINLPALLMPYLRAAMTNILSNAGFGTVLFPLINVYELAKDQNFPIIDHTTEEPS